MRKFWLSSEVRCFLLYSPRGWLEDYESEVVHRISNRISSLTGLDASFRAAEEMQVFEFT